MSSLTFLACLFAAGAAALGVSYLVEWWQKHARKLIGRAYDRLARITGRRRDWWILRRLHLSFHRAAWWWKTGRPLAMYPHYARVVSRDRKGLFSPGNRVIVGGSALAPGWPDDTVWICDPDHPLSPYLISESKLRPLKKPAPSIPYGGALLVEPFRERTTR
jgi:hypothetical protein